MFLSGVIGVFAIALIYIGVPFLYSRYSKLRLKCRAARSRALVLTFDDGPGSRLTPRILSLLSEYEARATFFLLGRNIRGNERTLQSIIAAGHEIGSHGYNHLHYWKVSPWRSLSDIKRGWRSIDAVTGRKGGMYPFRPPGGKLNIICLLFLLIKKVPIIYWTDVSGDTSLRKQHNKQTNLFRPPAGHTGVILIHDFDRADVDIDYKILDWLRSLLLAAKQNNVPILSVSELLKTKYG